MNERRPAWTWLFLAQLALVVAATVAATSGHFPSAVFRSPFDKVGHLCAYGGLAFFAVSFFGSARRFRVIALLLVAATLEELSQRAFPRRTFDLGDLAMNVVGIGLGGVAAILVALRTSHFDGAGMNAKTAKAEEAEEPGMGSGIEILERGARAHSCAVRARDPSVRD